MPKLMTGYTGVNIFASDDQALYKGIIGESNVVFNVGGCLSLDVTAADNSVTATISSGAFSFNGRIVRLQNAEILSLTGVVNGKYRRCKVVARYSVASDFKESVELVALCSSDVSDTAAGAADLTISGLNETSTINGSTTADFPLWDFVYSDDGLSGSAVQLFTVTDSLEALRTRLNEVEDGLNDETEARESATAQEANNRQNAISALQSSVTANAAAIASETSARTALDSRVQKLEKVSSVNTRTKIDGSVSFETEGEALAMSILLEWEGSVYMITAVGSTHNTTPGGSVRYNSRFVLVRKPGVSAELREINVRIPPVGYAQNGKITITIQCSNNDVYFCGARVLGATIVT